MVGIALHSIIPLRVEPKEEAEQETQMLFAQTCEVLEQKDRWTYIRLHDDEEVGWVDSKMLTIMSDEEAKEMAAIYDNQQFARVCMPMAYAVSENNGQTIPLTAGTKLPNYKAGTFSLLGVNFRIDPQMVIEQPLEWNENNILQTIRFFINTPYLWGGKNALGIDCSGFSQTIYSLFGIRLPRMARQQCTMHNAQCTIKSLSEAHCGDLAFFDHADEDPSKTKIIHVGILLDNERIIHASGRVKIEKIDERGIYSAELGRYTHHLAAIKRYE